ncbi:hypothetical protein OIO90_005410 [Microbotryomycetes sp. JL221]|nr:hypothetical protein OIO90_005410 [Microbotryomycetes sp. JL221]
MQKALNFFPNDDDDDTWAQSVLNNELTLINETFQLSTTLSNMVSSHFKQLSSFSKTLSKLEALGYSVPVQVSQSLKAITSSDIAKDVKLWVQAHKNQKQEAENNLRAAFMNLEQGKQHLNLLIGAESDQGAIFNRELNQSADKLHAKQSEQQETEQESERDPSPLPLKVTIADVAFVAGSAHGYEPKDNEFVGPGLHFPLGLSHLEPTLSCDDVQTRDIEGAFQIESEFSNGTAERNYVQNDQMHQPNQTDKVKKKRRLKSNIQSKNDQVHQPNQTHQKQKKKKFKKNKESQKFKKTMEEQPKVVGFDEIRLNQMFGAVGSSDIREISRTRKELCTDTKVAIKF